ncbi:lanthionine synthetase C family protein [Nonomuraea diastatica]|uniref:Lanthionine synthetase n=1 Tax=Nonomuraea diastatica TaxID=1848329 RepID=A0A4V2YDT3_9ACTN|nr:lanthionine synthetase C family protein [Nonomuraea diastatica]TDD16616.1 hypothetical protein E1294_30765 [Nonomuraea diastatica]
MSDADLLPEELSARCLSTARTIMTRLTDKARIDEAVVVARRETDLDIWSDGVSIYGGATGMAMAFSHGSRVFRQDAAEWRMHAGSWLRHAVATTQHTPIDAIGLSNGIAGLAMVISHLAADDSRYVHTLDSLRDKLVQQVNGLTKWPVGELYWGRYDVISGRSGILGCLLSEIDKYPTARQCVQALVDDLLDLCSIGNRDPWQGWRIPRDKYPPRDRSPDRYLYGYVDLGLAHGIPGPMAALSHAWTAGHRDQRVECAIRVLATMLIEVAQEDQWGLVWPRFMPFDDSGAIAPQKAPIAGAAYCYGGPGICSALLDAAEALEDSSLRIVAVKGVEAMLLRVQDGGMPLSPGLCHGIAGLLLICRKFALRTDSEAVRAGVVMLAEELLRWCDLRSPFVARDYRPFQVVGTAVGGQRGLFHDSPGLLEGAAGVALALMSVASPVDPQWARALLVE